MEKMRTIPELEKKADGANHGADFALKTAVLLFGSSAVLNVLDYFNSDWDTSEINTTGIAGGLAAATIHAYYKLKERRLNREIAELEHIQQQGIIIEGNATEISNPPQIKG